MSDPANLQIVEAAKSQLKLLLDGGKYADATRHCCQGLHKRPRKRKSSESGASSPVTSLQQDTLSLATRNHHEANECLWLHFEQAYCYYKLGKFDLALQAISSCLNNSIPRDLLNSSSSASNHKEQTPATLDVSTLQPKFQLLYAQVCMRLGRYEETRRVYSNVNVKSSNDLLELNRLSVDLAIAAAKNEAFDISDFCKAINTKIEAGNVNSYEMYYNWACAMIAKGRFEDAMQYIDLAQDLLYKELRDEMGEDVSSIQPEFCNILTQYAFLHLHFGNEELAANFTSQLVEKFDLADVDQSVLLVALSNALALVKNDVGAGSRHASHSYYKSIVKLLRKEAIVAKLSKQDLLAIHGNCVWSLLHVGKYKECRMHLQLFKSSLLNSLGREGSIDYWIYSGVVSLLEGDLNSCLSILGRARQQLGLTEYRLIATVARVFLSQLKFKDAQTLLDQSSESFMGCNVAFLEFAQLTMETHVGLASPQGVVDILQKITNVWEFGTLNLTGVMPNLVALIKDGCHFLESYGSHSQAAHFYRFLHQHDPSDESVVCGVLFNDSFKSECYAFGEDTSLEANFNHKIRINSAADTLEFQAPSAFNDKIQRLIKMIDAEELEQVADVETYMYPSSLTSSPTLRPLLGAFGAASSDTTSPRRRKRRRRSKPAKNPRLAGPDPERWLPKYERMAYKKKRRDVNKNTQGSTASTTSTSAGGTAANKPSTGAISTEAYVGRRSRAKKRGNR